jgi:valyl-tRNA synthetase
MAVAVNAADSRYQSVIGKFVELPITGRRIPIIADDHADPELGSGAVKITPGHDFNDFEVGKRAGFKPAEMLNMFDAEANVVQTADGLIPERFLGLHRCRKASEDGVRELVAAELKASGHLVMHEVKAKDGEVTLKDAEDRVIQTPFGDRGGVAIEPWLTDQWYVNAAELAKAPMAAVRDGRIEIVPKSWEKTWFNWMENIQPWCVSRQLLWGHRIPAWFGPIKREDGSLLVDVHSPDGEMVFVAESEAEALLLAKRYYDNGWPIELSKVGHWTGGGIQPVIELGTREVVTLNRDNDVLDTWFSSALWPFATLGWPDDQAPNPAHAELVEALPSASAKKGASSPSTSSGWAGVGAESAPSLLARHYPNDLLISGFDILFFWCARMAMQGMHFNYGQVPWKRLYLHGLVRAADGQKMSKSKGNVVDPLVLIDKYGADALRFFMAAMESQGRDVKMDERRVEGYRNFATKLWNAARFCQANGIGASNSLEAPAATLAVNRWIIGEVVETLAELDKALADLRFDAAANAIYHFVWDQFCDWYIELIKGQFDAETREVAGWVLDQILVMLHPFMPFVTEELWSALGERDTALIVAAWPQPSAKVDAEAKREVEWLIALVGNLRGAKAELGIPPGARLDAYLADPSDTTRGIVARNTGAIERLARLPAIHFAPPPPGAAMQIGAGDANIMVLLAGVIDIAAEQARLTKALEVSTKEAKSLAGRLSNPSFVEKAKPEAVDKARADHAVHAAEAERLAAALARLG